MSSRFHDRLVEARRNGEAPGQTSQGGPPADSDSGVKGTLTPLGPPGVFRCDDCSLPVDGDGAAGHVEWHRRLGC